MTDYANTTVTHLDDLDSPEAEPNTDREAMDLHITDTLTLVGARSAGTTTSPGASDEDNPTTA
jgi:hypothetical protein